MKILTLSYEFPPLGGGGSKVAQGLAENFVGLGHQVDIVTMSYKDLPRHEVVAGANVYRVPCLRRSVDICRPYELASYMLSALPATLQKLRESQYDLIHSHFLLPDGLTSIWPSRRNRIPLIVTAHGSDVPGYNPDRFKLIHKGIAPAWRSLVRAVDRIVCPSRFLADLILAHEPRARTVTIPNGIDLDKFNVNQTRRKSILVVTRMLERKGVQDVLNALSGTDLGFEVNIVGTGPYLDTLVRLSNELGMDTRFHGWLDNDSDELKALFETSEIFVFPSHAENFPVVLLEAMGAGLAIITTNQTGCREVVGDAALCVPPGDVAAIRSALEKLAGSNELCRTLGSAARHRLDEQFGWTAVARQYTSLFEAVIAENVPAAAPGASKLRDP